MALTEQEELELLELEEVEYQASLGGGKAPSSPESTNPGMLDKVGQAFAIEKQPGLPRSPVELLKQAARQTKEGFMSPMPGSVLGLPARMLQEQAGQIGATVARGLSTPGGMLPDVGKIPARLAGFGAAAITDPTTMVTGGALGKKAGEQLQKSVAPKLGKLLADVPEEATTTMIEAKAAFKQATGSESAIEGAVKNVINAMKTTLRKEGDEIGKVEKTLGIAKDPKQMIYEVAKGHDTGGYMTSLTKMKPEDLLMEYQTLSATKGMMANTEKISRLRQLQQALNDRVKFSNANGASPVGDQMQGLLKYAAKDIGNQIKSVPGGEALRTVQAKYARARKLYETLQPMLKDEGQGQALLENVFKSQSPRYKTIRRGLAELEKLSGEPVLTNLFAEFAKKSLSKLVGKPGRATAGAGLMLAGASTLPFNRLLGLGQMAAGGSVALSQSPRVLAAGTSALPSLTGAAGAGLGALFGAGTKLSNPNK
jgi:hypothetical protein